jgi:hypothetical protein
MLRIAIAAAAVTSSIILKLLRLIEVVQELFPEAYFRLIGKEIPEFR